MMECSNDPIIEIPESKFKELREKARKWDNYCFRQRQRISKLSPQQRKANARKAVLARWEKYHTNKQELALDDLQLFKHKDGVFTPLES